MPRNADRMVNNFFCVSNGNVVRQRCLGIGDNFRQAPASPRRNFHEMQMHSDGRANISSLASELRSSAICACYAKSVSIAFEWLSKAGARGSLTEPLLLFRSAFQKRHVSLTKNERLLRRQVVVTLMSK